MKYHISPDGPRPCKSQKGGCPYEKAGKPHFDNQTDAQNAYEGQMSESFGVVPKMKKTEQIRQGAYSKVDAVNSKLTAANKLVNDKVSSSLDRSRNTLERGQQWKSKQKTQLAKFTEDSKPYVAAASRIMKRIAMSFTNDVRTGTARVDERFKIREKVKTFLNKYAKPANDYVKSRAQLIRSIAQEEMQAARSLQPQPVIAQAKSSDWPVGRSDAPNPFRQERVRESVSA